MAPRNAFPGYDEPINTDLEPDDAMRAVMGECIEEEETDEG